MKKLVTIFTATVIIFVITLMPEFATDVFSQPPGFPSDPDAVPIDGGLGLLAAAGGAYALNKIRKNRKAE